MTAAERKVIERHPEAKCDFHTNGRCVWTPLFGIPRWWLGFGTTRERAWNDAASRLPVNVEHDA